jgi:hypothetical protein
MNEERTGLWLRQTEHICGNCDIDIPQQLTKSWWQPSAFGSDDLYVIFNKNEKSCLNSFVKMTKKYIFLKSTDSSICNQYCFVWENYVYCENNI